MGGARPLYEDDQRARKRGEGRGRMREERMWERER
jgi:hypothetical protein